MKKEPTRVAQRILKKELVKTPRLLFGCGSMKSPLPLGLVFFATSLSTIQALPPAASSPTPSPSPAPAASPPLLVLPDPPADLILGPDVNETLPFLIKRPNPVPLPIPLPTPRDDVLPVPPVEPTSPPKTNRPSFPIPRPNPAPRIPLRPVPAAAPFLSGPPDLLRFERAVPRMEVWRTGSDIPQVATKRRGRLDPILINGTEPVTLLLRFHPSLAGTTLEVFAREGLTLQSPAQVLRITPTGEVVLLVGLEPTKSRGEIAFRVDNVTTVLRFDQVPLWALLARERRIGGTAR
jgi:hypothetical protein